MAGIFIQGWQGQVGFGVETVFGTPVAPTIFQDVGQGSAELKTNKPNKELVTGIRGTAKPVKVSRATGKSDTSGAISGAIYPDDFFNAHVFAAVLGNNNAVVAVGGDGPANGYLHTFSDPAAEADYPDGLTIQEKVGGFGDSKTKDFASNYCNGITIEVPDSGLINMSTDWVGHSEGIPGTGTAAAATFSTDNPFEHYHAKLEIGNDSGSLVDVPFESLTFSHVVNVEMVNENFNCTKFPTGKRFGVPDISMEIVLKSIEDNTQYNHFFNDDTQYVRLTLKHDALAGTAPASEYEMTVNLPVSEFFGETEGLTGPEQITQPIQVQARFSTADDFTVQYTSKNSVSAVYAA
jgi:hypothetical protein